MTRDDAWDLLSARCERLGRDEIRVLAQIAARLDTGYAIYGSLDVCEQGRDWLREMREELLDALVYQACDYLRAVERAQPDTEPAPSPYATDVIIIDDEDLIPDAAPTQPDAGDE
jgi:hypothetical protein